MNRTEQGGLGWDRDTFYFIFSSYASRMMMVSLEHFPFESVDPNLCLSTVGAGVNEVK